MSKVTRRIILDVVLTIMLIFEMLYQFTGNALHEYIGFAFFACIIIHLIFERKWLGNTFASICTNTLKKRRKVLAVIALFLSLDILVLGASSLIISNTLWNLGLDMSFANPGNIWVPIHTGSAYALCVIVAGHLASHWTLLAKQMHIEYNPARRQAIGSAVNAAVGIGVLALGITGYSRVAEAMNNERLIEQKIAENNRDNTNISSVEEQSDNGQKSSESGQNSSTTNNVNNTSKNSNSSTSSSSSGSINDTGTSTQSEGDNTKSKGKTRSNKGNQQYSTPSQDSSSSTAPSSPSPSSPSQNDNKGNTNNQNNNSNNNGSNSSNEGICTLCRKYCSLSNPRCDKPYRTGLI